MLEKGAREGSSAGPSVLSKICAPCLSVYHIEAEWRIYESVTWVITNSCNGLSPIWRQVITWRNTDLVHTHYTPPHLQQTHTVLPLDDGAYWMGIQFRLFLIRQPISEDPALKIAELFSQIISCCFYWHRDNTIISTILYFLISSPYNDGTTTG